MNSFARQFLRAASLAAIVLALGQIVRGDIFDTNSTTSGFGVTNGNTYDWWTANFWSDGTAAANDAGTAATVTWQGTSLVSEQAYLVGSGTAGQNYTVRLGATGSTDTYIQNLAINVKADGSGALTGAAGNVTIGNTGDTGKLIIRATNSVGAQNSGTLTINNAVDLNAQTLNFRGGNVIINGAVSGTGASNFTLASGAFSLTSGTLTLAGDNSFAGNTSIASGYTLRLQHANALGATGGTNTVSLGGTMEVAGGVSIVSGESISINGEGVSFIGALRAGAGGGTWMGGVTLAGTARLGATAGNTLTVTGSIANGAGSILNISGESGTGVVVLNPTTSNTYTGATGIVRGILRLGKSDALPTGTTLDMDLANGVTDAATFDMASFSQTVAALQDTATTNINGKITNSVGSSTSTLTVNQASNTQYDSIIENGSGTVALIKSGVGALTITGANTYTGGTTIKNGSLVVAGGDDRLATAGSVTIGDVATSGKLVIGTASVARSQTLAGLTATGNGGAVVGGNASNSVLTLNIASGTNTFTGTLGGGGTNENNLALTKSGAGILKLTAPNTYGGTTTLTTGTIQIGAGNVGSVGAITSSAIGTGTLNLNGGTISSDSTTPRTILNPVTYSTASTFGDVTNTGKLTFSADVNLGTTQKTMTVNSDVQFDGILSGTGGGISLGTSAGYGKLTLTNTLNSFTGAVGLAANSGTLRITSSGALGVGPKTVTNTGASGLVPVTGANLLELDSNGGTDISLASNISFTTSGSAGVILNTAGNNTIAGNFNMTSGNGNTKIISNGGTLELTGTFTGNAADRHLELAGSTIGNIFSGTLVNGTGQTTWLTKSGAGTWTVSGGLNTFTGNTKVNGGTLKLANNLAIQNSVFDTSGAGTLDTQGVTTPTFGGLTAGGNLVLHSNVTSLTLNVGGTQTYSGSLSGGTGLAFTKSGAGTQVLSGSNTFGGNTSISGGYLNIANNSALNGSSVVAITSAGVAGGALQLANGITVSGKSITINGYGPNVRGSLQAAANATAEWAGTVILGNTLTDSRVGAAAGGILTLSGPIQDGFINNLIISAENAASATPGKVVVSGTTNTYTGQTQIFRGILAIGADDALPTGSVLNVHAVSGITDTAVFDLNNFNQQVAGLTRGNTSGPAIVTNTGASTRTLTINNSSNYAFDSAITGNLALDKSGAGTQSLSGANTYTGATSINGGTLLMGASNVIPGTSTVELGGGTLNSAGFSNATTGTLDLLSSSTIDFGTSGAGSSVLTFDNLNWTDGTLSVWNWTGSVWSTGGAEQLKFTSGSVGAFANVQFYSDGGSTLLSSGGHFVSVAGGVELVPVPEPGAILAALLLLVPGFSRRRNQGSFEIAAGK